jgi:hypothetical protein
LAPRLAAAAASQQGVFTGDQARDAGYTSNEIQRMRRPGSVPRWWSIRRGVYVVKSWYDGLPAVDQYRVRLAALGLVLHAPAVLSHVSGAVLLGLEMLDPDLSELHVTRAELKGSRHEAGVHHHAAELSVFDVLCQPGEPAVTTAVRTAVDVARQTDRLEQAVAVCDSALRSGVTHEQLTAVMNRCRSWPGARLASRAVSMADGRAANPGESWSRVVLTTHDQAPTHLQREVRDQRGLVGYVDFFWEDDGVVGEFDGKVKYAVPLGASPDEATRSIVAEKIREDRLRAQGLEVVRWGYGELYRPEVIVAKVVRARQRAAARERRTG